MQDDQILLSPNQTLTPNAAASLRTVSRLAFFLPFSIRDMYAASAFNSAAK